MIVENKIRLDMAKRQHPVVVDAVQGDSNTRVIVASLYANSVPWMPTDGATLSLAYKKPDGTSGWYDTMPDGSTPAISVEENIVTVILVSQALSVAGHVNCFIRVQGGADNISTFPFVVNVEANPTLNATKSENYYNVQVWEDVNTKLVGIFEQEFTDDEMERARENINAAPNTSEYSEDVLVEIPRAPFVVYENAYTNVSGDLVEKTGCSVYRIYLGEENKDLFGKNLKIKTYAYGEMAYGFEGEPGTLINPNADVTGNPASGVCEFYVTLPDVDPEMANQFFHVSFAENNYTDFEVYEVRKSTVWDEIKKIKEKPEQDAVLYVEQSLTSAQQAQARENIGITEVVQDYYSTTREEIGVSGENVNTAYIWGLYDALMAEYPDKVQKKAHTNNDGTFTNYEYVISTGNYDEIGAELRKRDTDIKKPKYLILSGIHGSERPNVISTYRLVKDILSVKNVIAPLLDGAVIHVLPVGTPDGFDASSYYNANGVNINRDFTADVFQKETQVIANWLNANSDADLFIDCHNQSIVNEVTTIIGLADNQAVDNAKKIALRGLDRIIPYWRDVIKYRKTLLARESTEDEDCVERPVIFSYSCSVDELGGAICYAVDKVGITSISLETSTYQNGDYTEWMKDKKVCTPETVAAGAEALGNILAEFYEQALSEVTDMTDVNDKLDLIMESVNSGFHTESGVMVLDEDMLPASGKTTITVKIPCPKGAKTVDFHADGDTLVAIKATEGTAYLASVLANCYAPNIVNEAGQIRSLAMAQKNVANYGWVLDYGSIRADNSDGLSFSCAALKAGRYEWIAYYWNE